MENLLLVSGNDTGMNMLRQLVGDRHYDHIFKSTTGGETRRLLLENELDLIIINAPLSDEFGEELAEEAATGNAAVILLVKSELADRVSYKLECSDVMIVQKPTSISLFDAVLSMADIMYAKLLRMDKECRKLQRRMEETKAVATAKCLLVDKEKLSEAQAHRYIEKLAMDSRTPRLQIARDLIEKYSRMQPEDS